MNVPITVAKLCAQHQGSTAMNTKTEIRIISCELGQYRLNSNE